MKGSLVPSRCKGQPGKRGPQVSDRVPIRVYQRAGPVLVRDFVIVSSPLPICPRTLSVPAIVSLHCSLLPPPPPLLKISYSSPANHPTQSTHLSCSPAPPPSFAQPSPPPGHGPPPPSLTARLRAPPPAAAAPVSPARRARAAPGLEDRGPLRPVVGVPPAPAVRSSVPRATGPRRGRAARRAAVPGDDEWLGAVPAPQEGCCRQGRGVLASDVAVA